jgi:hypothetical protein
MLMLAAGLAVVGGGCKKNPPKPAATTPTAPAPTQPTAPSPPAGADTQYQAGAGAIQNARKAAERTQLLSLMNGLGVYILSLDTDKGKMPTKQEVYAALKDDITQRPLLEKINDGTIILTGSTNRAGLWAYEKGADVSGGVGLVGPSAQRLSADDIKKLLRGG